MVACGLPAASRCPELEWVHAQGAFGGRSLALLQLHPVTIRHKQNPLRTREYGLVAEEVAKVYSGPGDARARRRSRVGAVL